MSDQQLEAIRSLLRCVPSGRVTSYGRLAARAGIPRGARVAVAALRQTPVDQPLPWHRVLRADGRIAFATDHPHYAEQLRRLRDEGVVVSGGRVDLSRFGWTEDSPELLLPADD